MSNLAQRDIEDGKNLIVDILNVSYLRTNYAGLSGLPMEDYFKVLRVHIVDNLKTLPLGSEARSNGNGWSGSLTGHWSATA